jgi:glycosyltransferase involved in cell wall biosynthesis
MSTTNSRQEGKRFFDFIFVHPHLNYGGAEKHSVLLANEMAKNNYKVAFFLHARSGALLSQLDPRIEVFSSKFESHLLIPVVAMEFSKFLESVDKTHVIIRLWSSAMMSSLVQKHHAHMFHFFEDLDPLSHTEYITLGPVKRMLIKRIFRNEASLIANTKQTAKAMVSVYGLERIPPVIYPCIEYDSSLFKAEEAKTFNGDIFTAISVGSLIPRKGHELIIKALGIYGKPVEYKVVGEGPLVEDIEDMCSNTSNVRLNYLGPLKTPMLEIWKSDVLLHGAVSESFGMVIVEALALGKPAIVVDSMGAREIQELGGGLFDLTIVPANPKALADAIEGLHSRKKVNITQESLKALERFSPKTNLNDLEKLLGRK